MGLISWSTKLSNTSRFFSRHAIFTAEVNCIVQFCVALILQMSYSLVKQSWIIDCKKGLEGIHEGHLEIGGGQKTTKKTLTAYFTNYMEGTNLIIPKFKLNSMIIYEA